jgi:uncharacterized protein YjbJ (UPF0337 family)
MNRDQVKGAAKDVAGKVQQKVGELTGNKTQQAKGVGKQVEGKVQKGVGNVEHVLDKADRKTRWEAERTLKEIARVAGGPPMVDSREGNNNGQD